MNLKHKAHALALANMQQQFYVLVKQVNASLEDPNSLDVEKFKRDCLKLQELAIRAATFEKG